MRACEPSFGGEGPAGHERVGHDGVGLDALSQAHEHARALATLGEEAGLAEGGGVARDVGLRLVQELGQLAHGQLLVVREGQEAQAHGLGEEPIELPPRAALAVRRGDHGQAYMSSCARMQVARNQAQKRGAQEALACGGECG